MFVLTGIKPLLDDSIADVRFKAITICARLGLKTNEDAFRQEAVRLLVTACNDKDISLAGSAMDYLTHFYSTDYTKETLDEIRGLLTKQPPLFEKLVRLAGFLEMKDQQSFFESILLTGKASTKLQWNLHLALARMGRENSTAEILKLIKNYPVDDNVMYHILPDLVYTRQKPVFDYLLEILYSDKRNCTSPNPYYSGNILCGYRVMEALAPVVKDFPFKTNKSNEIITKDYEKALDVTRQWFKDQTSYECNREIY